MFGSVNANWMKRAIAGLLSLALAHSAGAGTYTGPVKPFLYGATLYLDASFTQMSGRPACATRTLVRLQETDMNDPVYKGKFAMLLAAWISDRTVVLYGTGACSSEGDEWVSVVIPN